MSGEKAINQELADPISRLDGVSSLFDGDDYAVSRQGGRARSYKIDYARLAQQLVSDISARFGLSSMAFRETYEYARFDHQHRYTRVQCWPGFKKGDRDNMLRLAVVRISSDGGSSDVDIYQPIPAVPPPDRPDIGAVRFLATDQLSTQAQISQAINNGTFDGWVYPDGQTYGERQGEYDFSEAYARYGGSGGRFKVPFLGGFVKANPGTYWNGDALRTHAGRTTIPSHTHEI